MSEPMAVLKGTLDVLILKCLAFGPIHGFGITCWLEERSSGALAIDDSALYQALHRLEAKGLIDTEWGTSENNRRARYYSLTPRGRRHLNEELATWRRMSRAINLVLDVTAVN